MPSDKNVQEEKVEQVPEKDVSAERAPEDLSASLWQSRENRISADSAASKPHTAPTLEIVDEKGAAANEQKKAAVETSDQKLTPRKLIDKAEKAPNPEELKEANASLFKAAVEAENTSIWQLPKYIRGLPKPTPDLGCVSSFSDRFRRAMEMEGVINSAKDADHRKYYQVNITDVTNVMMNDNLLRRIDPSEVREGDVIIGQRPGTSSRHMGIIGKVENGALQSYHNHGGKWIKQSAHERFDKQYPQVEYYRAYMPPKKNG